MKNWIIVATFFCLWLSTSFSGEVQSVLAYALISTVGILHGANDINILMSENEKPDNGRAFWKALLLYITIVLAIIILFTVYPLLAMILFVAFSGFHFGEQHLKKKVIKKTKWSIVIFAIYGMAILFLIFYAKSNEVIPILKQLTAITLEKSFFKIVLISSLLASFAGFLIFRKSFKINIFKEAFYLLVLFVVFKTANLLWGFCIYFVLWHSVPSIQDQLHFSYGKADKSSFVKYFKACWPYWGVSILGLTIVYFVFKENNQLLINVLLYLLAAITIPHILVMSRLERKDNYC